ncbi:MAG: prepilin-type N-terminal cleavage/methylation domain-containing protein [Opitutaceae bacterium]
MSPTNVKTPKAVTAGFTLVELIVSVSLSAIVFAGILGGFTFLGRNLTRLVNTQEQDSKSRRAFYVFGQDINRATKIYDVSSTSFTVLVSPAADPTLHPDGDVVRYSYVKPEEERGVLTRTLNGMETSPLLANLTTFAFKYYNQAGGFLSVTATQGSNVDLTKSSAPSIKEVELSFSSAAGNSPGGTQAVYSGSSPRFLLRNRPLLK